MRTADRSSSSRSWSIALAGLLALACGSQQRGPGAWSRLIDEPPQLELRPADLADLDCTRKVDLRGGRLPEDLELVEGRVHPGGGSGVSIVGGAAAPRLRLRGALSSDAYDGVRLILSGLRRGKLEVVRVPVRDPSGASAVALPPWGAGANRDRYLVDWRATAWRGPFQLEIRPTTTAGEIVTLAEICLGRMRGALEGLAAADGRAWKITVGGETRDAVLLDPRGRRDRFRVAGKTRLRFGLGLFAGNASLFTITVRAHGPGGTRQILADEPWAVSSAQPEWRDFDAEFDPPGDGDIEVELLVRSQGGDDDWLLAYASPQARSVSRLERRPPNMVLVMIDTLRADHLSLYGYSRATSPQLEAWAARRATVFERVVAPSGWTLPSHFSLFTGFDAFRHPANYYRGAYDGESFRFLAAELWRAGYRTQAITGGSFVSPSFGLATGFESFRVWDGGFGRREELAANLRAANEFLDRAGEDPFLLFLHTYEVHTPNAPRQPHFSRFSSLPVDFAAELVTDEPDPQTGFEGSLHAVLTRNGERIDPVPPELEELPRDAYDSAIAHVDAQLAPLLDRLSRAPFRDDTIVVVASDHGESLELERAGHGYLTADNLLVPMLISIPGRRGGDRIDSQVRLHDLYATLLDLAMLKPPTPTDSRSLLPILDGAESEDRIAYAYAASMNYGLARWGRAGSVVEWRNSPWKPSAGRIYSAARLVPPGDLDAWAELRIAVRDLQRKYDQGALGLRLELATDSTVPVDVELASELVDPVSTKSPAPPAAGLEWAEIGLLRVRLSATEALRLQFERLPRQEVGFEIRARRADGCGAVRSLTVAAALADLASGKRFELDLPGCGSDSEARSLALSLGFRGGLPKQGLNAADEDLANELRALGYVD